VDILEPLKKEKWLKVRAKKNQVEDSDAVQSKE
jgi:hypothetical protein